LNITRVVRDGLQQELVDLVGDRAAGPGRRDVIVREQRPGQLLELVSDPEDRLRRLGHPVAADDPPSLAVPVVTGHWQLAVVVQRLGQGRGRGLQRGRLRPQPAGQRCRTR